MGKHHNKTKSMSGFRFRFPPTAAGKHGTDQSVLQAPPHPGPAPNRVPPAPDGGLGLVPTEFRAEVVRGWPRRPSEAGPAGGGQIRPLFSRAGSFPASHGGLWVPVRPAKCATSACGPYTPSQVPHPGRDKGAAWDQISEFSEAAVAKSHHDHPPRTAPAGHLPGRSPVTVPPHRCIGVDGTPGEGLAPLALTYRPAGPPQRRAPAGNAPKRGGPRPAVEGPLEGGGERWT